ncbi:hypothetical protein [Chryseobacterium binzhouense]|uniref:hypothetical protein n=1 Tax=Chryseobacterium binzhouense TaxID=2593646 RepID=UPI00117C47A5|nr:hypothetical protein [Chryseobacterium binzhouense]
MKKYILFLSVIMNLNALLAQTGNVGVGTTVPRSTLDVNGTMNINNEINLGGTNSAVGNSGTAGDLISANGAANPTWKKFDLPNGYLDGFVLTGSSLKSTTVGASFDGTGANGIPYTENQTLPASWVEIAGVSEPTFRITKATNIVNIFVQTVAQVTGTDATGSFGCGIYIDDQLKFTRTGIVSGASGSYRILTLNASIPNLSVGTHSYKFACAQRNVPVGSTLTIGQSQNTAVLSTTMAGTSSSLKILEPIQ